MDVANAAFPAFVTCMLFYTGNLLVWNAIPKWLRWVVYLDFLHWPFGAITINQFQGTGATWVQGIPVLEYFHLNVIGGPWVYIAIELAFFFGFCTLAWAGLAFRRFDKR